MRNLLPVGWNVSSSPRLPLQYTERHSTIMGINDDGERMCTAHFVEMVVRTLRHEVGDLLQSVYSSVAILKERLPRSQTLERTILADLRSRAEACKNELDATHDLICPLSLNLDWVELSELTAGIAASFSLRNPGLQIVCEAPRPTKVWGDAAKLMQAGTMLMMSLCQAARSKILIRVSKESPDGNTEWSFTHDGPPAAAEQLSWLSAPFSTTRHARFGLGLAFARRIIDLQGGRITAGEAADGGFQVVLVLPPGPAQE
ncbi:MAG TPA: ATP-binding protein [Gemmataceae bacterium]|nr:ATP-binding protein [Gemmataceae bacterium]